MNQSLVDLLTDDQTANLLVTGLPEAFEIVGANFPTDNPAIGVLREQVLIGFLRASLGGRRVKVAASGVQRGYDLYVDGQPLSLKTVSGKSGIKMIWTVDQTSVNRELSLYQPSEDILLVRLFWGHRQQSIFYIPIEAQMDVYNHQDQSYLSVKTGTNHRGIEIGKQSMLALESHPLTISLDVDWQKHGLSFRAYRRWEAFWRRKSGQ